MGMNESEIYQLLNLAEDYLLDGFRHEHPALAPRSGAESTPDPSRQQAIDQIAREVAACTRCALHRERRQTVSGEGAIDPLVMVVGEGPGGEEDRIGRPFVGRAGRYLDRWLTAVGLDRKTNCFIGNIVKCRPPGNRDPLPGESAACLPYLKRQIDILKPRAILTLGRIATQILCGCSEGIGRLRGKELDYRGIPVVATYHPSAVLRNTDLRSPVWDDLRRLKALPVVAGALAGSPASQGGQGGQADSPPASPEARLTRSPD